MMQIYQGGPRRKNTDAIELKPRNENIFIKPRKKKYYLEAKKNVESREHYSN